MNFIVNSFDDESYEHRRRADGGQSLHETIVAAWRELERASAGADELVAIQTTLADETISPAEIARELAREGVELRHPEIINCDARWREAQVARQAQVFAGVIALRGTLPLSLRETAGCLAELERLRNRFAVAEDELALSELMALAIEARKTALSRARDSSLSKPVRESQAEIAEWLRVWLETPSIFSQWLELRKASAAFTAKFPDY